MPFDLNNYKGMFYDTENEKYTCPLTGAHFRIGDLCQRLENLRQHRQEQDNIHRKQISVAPMKYI